MDPVIKSSITSMMLAAAAYGLGWASTHGLISAADINTDASAIVSVIFIIAGIAVAWFKTRQATPTALVQSLNKTDDGPKAMIKSINETNNGLKVVEASSTDAPAVSAPIK